MDGMSQRRSSVGEHPIGRRRRAGSFHGFSRQGHVRGGVVSPSPPSSSRRKYDEEMSQLTELIKEKERQSTRVDVDNTDISEKMVSLETQIKEEDTQRSRLLSDAKSMEDQLRQLGTQVSKKRDESRKMLLGLRFKSQELYDAQIERVEQQLQGGQLSESEERRFRTEIENFKVSKTRLSNYLTMKGEIDKLRNDQEELRKNRDISYHKAKEHKEACNSFKDQLKEQKAQWESRKDKQRFLKAEREALTKEIHELYQQKEKLRRDFKQQEAESSEAQRQLLAQESAKEKEEQRKKLEERKMMREAKRKMRDLELDQQQESALDEERQVCSALIAYLTRLQTTNGGIAALPIVEGSPSSSTSVSPEDSLTQTREGSTTPQPGRYHVRSEVEWVPASGRRRSKREKERKKSMKQQQKRLNINATTYPQFNLLGIRPPATPADIPATLTELQQKLCYIESRRFKANSEAGDSGIMLSAGISETSEVYYSEDLASGEATPNHKPSKGEHSVSPLPPLPQPSSESALIKETLPNGHIESNLA